MAKPASDIDGASCDHVAALPWWIEADGQLRILMVESRTNGKWIIPKGWPIPRKSAGQVAGIEAKEEAGVEGVASETAIGPYRYIKIFDHGTSSPAQALVYPPPVTDELTK